MKTVSTTQADSTDVLIVGAGPTGLTLANILAKQGIRFRLIERDRAPINESRALWVHARTLELWDKIDLLKGAFEVGVRFDKVSMLLEGKERGSLPYQGTGLSPHPYALVLEQSKTQAMLLNALGKHGIAPEWGVTLETFQDNQTHVTCQLKHPDGSLGTIKARYLVASDGATSTIRNQLGLTFEGDTYDSSFFLADVNMETSLNNDRLHINFTKKGFFAFFPLYSTNPTQKHFRIIGSLDPEHTAALEKSRAVGAKIAIDIEEIEAHINSKSGLQVKILEARWASVYRIHCRMTNKYRVGNVFLTGDAAHIHSPAGGQGMNTGIADGFNLGWKLAAVLRGQAHEKLLESYQAERLPVAQEVLKTADKLFALETTQHPVLQQFKPFFIQAVSGLLSTLPAGRNLIFRFLSQIGVHYRNTPFVKTHRAMPQHLQAGDRLPYLELDKATTTHSIIRGLEHHLLVLGTQDLDTALRFKLQTLCARHGFTLQVVKHQSIKKLTGNQNALVLVRPDGYIAFAAPLTALDDLEAYLKGLYLTFEQPKQGRYNQETGRLEPQLPRIPEVKLA
jgi:2-polyprenyl-6-methoxyphenol hydroxylase-like FAD-dependent oxidoreductase